MRWECAFLHYVLIALLVLHCITFSVFCSAVTIRREKKITQKFDTESPFAHFICSRTLGFEKAEGFLKLVASCGG